MQGKLSNQLIQPYPPPPTHHPPPTAAGPRHRAPGCRGGGGISCRPVAWPLPISSSRGS